MDEKLEEYIDGLITQVLKSPNFVNNSKDKQQLGQKIRDRLNNLIFDTLLDSLTPDQLKTLKDIPMDSQKMEEKLQEYASLTPFLAKKLEEAINDEVEMIKNNPKMIFESQTS